MCIVKMCKLLCLEGAAVVLIALLQLMSAHGSIVYGSPTDQHTAYDSPTWSWTDCSESYRAEVYDVSVVL